MSSPLGAADLGFGADSDLVVLAGSPCLGHRASLGSSSLAGCSFLPRGPVAVPGALRASSPPHPPGPLPPLGPRPRCCAFRGIDSRPGGSGSTATLMITEAAPSAPPPLSATLAGTPAVTGPQRQRVSSSALVPTAVPGSTARSTCLPTPGKRDPVSHCCGVTICSRHPPSLLQGEGSLPPQGGRARERWSLVLRTHQPALSSQENGNQSKEPRFLLSARPSGQLSALSGSALLLLREELSGPVLKRFQQSPRAAAQRDR